MAFFQLIDVSSSSFSRMHTITLITVMFISFFSYSFSSPISPIDINQNNFNLDKRLYAENYRPKHIPWQSSPLLSTLHDLNTDEYPIALRNRLASLMLKAALLQADHRFHVPLRHLHDDDRRYVSQGFHAMRG
ncbi:hypothetical protein I4U23_010259 [Adineta vaga]|nr:hypothetical protein I4U23_010259 [Adineta vaga]